MSYFNAFFLVFTEILVEDIMEVIELVYVDEKLFENLGLSKLVGFFDNFCFSQF